MRTLPKSHITLSHVKNAARSIGLEIKRRRNELDEHNVLRQLLEDVPVDLVVDVGANEGQYGALLRACGYHGRILSFEPLPDAYELLRAGTAGDENWHVADRVALGASSAEISLNIASNSASSSVLQMLNLHEEVAPQSKYVGSVRVDMRRLDDVLVESRHEFTRGLLKVDTQGFEDRVLTGAGELLESFVAVQLELGLAPLYEGQAQTADLVSTLAKRGFILSYVIPGFRDNRGRLLQMDGIFVHARGKSHTAV